MQSRGKSPAIAGSDRTAIAARVVAFLHARHPSKMADNVAAETGISSNTIRAIEERQSAPSAAVLYRLAAIYGPDFLAQCFPGLAWLGDAATRERQRALHARISAAHDELNRISAG